MVKGNTFPFKSVKEHQVAGLLKALEGFWYKISDSPIFAGMNSRYTAQKPFDGIYIKAKKAFVTPIFYKERRYKKVFLIPIQEFIKLEGKSIKFGELEKTKFESFYI